jgi:hypothetical protein
MITEQTGAAVTTKGIYVAPGRPAPEGESRLHLLIEGPTELCVKRAKQEIKRILEETTEKVRSCGGVCGGGGRGGGGRGAGPGAAHCLAWRRMLHAASAGLRMGEGGKGARRQRAGPPSWPSPLPARRPAGEC